MYVCVCVYVWMCVYLYMIINLFPKSLIWGRAEVDGKEILLNGKPISN